MKRIKESIILDILLSFILILYAVLLNYSPDKIYKLSTIVISITLVIIGATGLYKFWISSKEGKNNYLQLAISALTIILSIFVILKFSSITTILSLVFGILMTLTTVMKYQYIKVLYDIKHNNYKLLIYQLSIMTILSIFTIIGFVIKSLDAQDRLSFFLIAFGLFNISVAYTYKLSKNEIINSESKEIISVKDGKIIPKNKDSLK